MKRGLLIAGGTLGGLGAVMSITPPQLSGTNSLSMAGIGAVSSGAVDTAPSSAPAANSSATATPTQAAATKPAGTKPGTTKPAKGSAGAGTNSNSNTNNNSNAGSVATDPAPAVTTAAPAPAGVNGTFVGPSIFVQYGNVQVEITVVNGKITDAKAIVAPTGKNDRYTNMAVPVLKKQTLAAQSANIQGASGASYTSYGWFKSLQGALAKAGL
jgi:uncharacterized protein with FMN-binding domain